MGALDGWYMDGSLGVGTAFDEQNDAQSVSWKGVGSAIRHDGWETLNLLDSRLAAPSQGPNLNWWGLNAGRKAVRLGYISSRFANTADGGSSGYMSFFTKAQSGDVVEALRITEQQVVKVSNSLTVASALTVSNSLTVGPLTSGQAPGRLEVSGLGAEIAFVRRSLAAWPQAPAPGDVFSWYNPDGTARLRTGGPVTSLRCSPTAMSGLARPPLERASMSRVSVW